MMKGWKIQSHLKDGLLPKHRTVIVTNFGRSRAIPRQSKIAHYSVRDVNQREIEKSGENFAYCFYIR